MNCWTGLGRLTADPELTYSQNGMAIAKFCLAVNRMKDKTDFIQCIAFKGTAETLANYCKKGDLIGAEGSLNVDDYTSSKGEKRRTHQIAVNRIHFTGRSSASESKAQKDPIPHDHDDPFADE